MYVYHPDGTYRAASRRAGPVDALATHTTPNPRSIRTGAQKWPAFGGRGGCELTLRGDTLNGLVFKDKWKPPSTGRLCCRCMVARWRERGAKSKRILAKIKR